jgi:hypothetical protein
MKWVKTPMTGMDIEIELLQEDGFVSIYGDVKITCPMYGKGSIRFLSEISKERSRMDYDTIWLITGERGKGKSSLGGQMALEVDPRFPVDNMTFRLLDFNRVIANNPDCCPEKGVYPQAALDEAGEELYAGDFSRRIAKSMVKRFQVIRAKRQTVYLILPHKMFLLRGMRETLPTYWIDVETLHGERGYAVVRAGDPNCFNLEKFWKPVFVIKFDKMSGQWWDEYQLKKNKFIDEIVADESDITKRTNTITDDMIAEKWGCSVRTLQRWRKNLKPDA